MRTIAVIACCVAVAACGSLPKAWTRPDGAPITPAQLQMDDTICRGEVEKAAAQGGQRGTLDLPTGPDRQDTKIYEGCMAQHGYLAAK
jgi:hypothetical protein